MSNNFAGKKQNKIYDVYTLLQPRAINDGDGRTAPRTASMDTFR